MTDIVPTSSPESASAIARAAEWAVTNKFLTALTRFATPICIVAVGWGYSSVTTLIAQQQETNGKVVAIERSIIDARTTIADLTLALGNARERVAQLQSIQTAQGTLDVRLGEFRQDLRDIRTRLDQMTYPPSMRYQSPQQ